METECLGHSETAQASSKLPAVIPAPKSARRAAELAIIKRIRFHHLRHTCGALLRQKGVPLEVIMQLMRHADIRETLLYAKPDHKAVQNTVRLLDVA